MRAIQPSLIFATDGYVILCDEPGCSAEVEGEDLLDAEAKARALGWTLRPDCCPAHREAA